VQKPKLKAEAPSELVLVKDLTLNLIEVESKPKKIFNAVFL